MDRLQLRPWGERPGSGSRSRGVGLTIKSSPAVRGGHLTTVFGDPFRTGASTWTLSWRTGGCTLDSCAVAHCAGTPGSEGGATYTRTRVTPREGLGVGAEVPIQAVAQATGYRTCHGMGLGAERWLKGATPGPLPTRRFWTWSLGSTVSALQESPHSGSQTSRKVARAARPGPRTGTGTSQDLGVTPSRWKPAVHSAPRGAGGALSQVWPWAACVARGHDSELQATCSGMGGRPRWSSPEALPA